MWKLIYFSYFFFLYLSLKDINVTETLNHLFSHQIGTFIKLILRMVNLIDHVRSVLLELKSMYLYNLLEDAPEKLMFDVVCNCSLYLL